MCFYGNPLPDSDEIEQAMYDDILKRREENMLSISKKIEILKEKAKVSESVCYKAIEYARGDLRNAFQYCNAYTKMLEIDKLSFDEKVKWLAHLNILISKL